MHDAAQLDSNGTPDPERPAGSDGTTAAASAEVADAVAAATFELRRLLLEKENKIQEQAKLLELLYAVDNEQTATIERLTAEVKSHEEAGLVEGEGPRERSRIIARYATQVQELEDTVAIRGNLIEESVRKNRALLNECESLRTQLDTATAASHERLAMIEQMTEEYEKRRRLFETERTNLESQVEILKSASGERLDLIEVMTREFEKRSQALQNERDTLRFQLDILNAASGERLALVEAMSQEFEKRTAALLSERDNLESQIKVANEASAERLALIDMMSRELEIQRQETAVQRAAAAERAEIIVRLEALLSQSTIRQRVMRLLRLRR